MPAMVWSKTPEGVLDYANEKLLEFLGLDILELKSLEDNGGTRAVRLEL